MVIEGFVDNSWKCKLLNSILWEPVKSVDCNTSSLSPSGGRLLHFY